MKCPKQSLTVRVPMPDGTTEVVHMDVYPARMWKRIERLRKSRKGTIRYGRDASIIVRTLTTVPSPSPLP